MPQQVHEPRERAIVSDAPWPRAAIKRCHKKLEIDLAFAECGGVPHLIALREHTKQCLCLSNLGIPASGKSLRARARGRHGRRNRLVHP